MKKASRKQMEEESKRVYGQPSVAPSQDENTAAFVDCKERVHRWELKIDATYADTEVHYPMDNNLIKTDCCKQSEYLEMICEGLGIAGPKLHNKDARRCRNYSNTIWASFIRGLMAMLTT